MISRTDMHRVKKTKPYQLRAYEPCPCGSGKRLDCCCLGVDGKLRKKVANLTPPPPVTGHAHPGCYLGFMHDCSPKISGEHYMSKAVLEAIGGPLRVTGMPWLPEGTTREVGVNSLTAKILCTRHNAALSPLDQAAGEFFRALRQVTIYLKTKTLSRKMPVKLFSGEELELWMLKAVCGMFHARAAAAGRTAVADTHTLDHRRVAAALELGLWDQGCGLYMTGNVGTVHSAANDCQFAPLLSATEPRIAGGQFFVAGFGFYLEIDRTGANISGPSSLIHRPSEMLFSQGPRRTSIILTWPPGTPSRSVHLNRRNPPKEDHP